MPGPPWWGSTTYGSIALGRPDAEDLLQDRAFALEAWEDFQAGWESFSPPGNFPYKEGGKGGSFTPSTTQACTHCGLCVRQCPMQAIGEDCAAIDGEKCIACFRCVKNCPVQAKGGVHPRVPKLCRGFLRKAERAQGEPVFSGQGLNFQKVLVANGEFSPQELRDFFQSYSNRTMDPPLEQIK